MKKKLQEELNKILAIDNRNLFIVEDINQLRLLGLVEHRENRYEGEGYQQLQPNNKELSELFFKADICLIINSSLVIRRCTFNNVRLYL